MDVGNLISGSSTFSKSNLNNWKFSVLLLKTDLENFERYFASMWYECNCAVVWHCLSLGLEWKLTFSSFGIAFGIAFLWELPFFGIRMKTDLFQSCGHCWVFQICWHIECSIFTASSFRIWNSSTGIPPPPLAWFVVMLPKTHLTSHSRVSGSRWVITPLWLSGSLSSFLYSSSMKSEVKWKSLSCVWFLYYTVHGILQARILKWVAFPFSRGSFQSRDQIQVSHTADRFFTSWAMREAQEYWSGKPILSPVDLPNPEIEPRPPALQETNGAIKEASSSVTHPKLCKNQGYLTGIYCNLFLTECLFITDKKIFWINICNGDLFGL